MEEEILNFYRALNEHKNQSGFNTRGSLRGLEIPERNNFEGKRMRRRAFKWAFSMGIAGGGGGG